MVFMVAKFAQLATGIRSCAFWRLCHSFARFDAARFDAARFDAHGDHRNREHDSGSFRVQRTDNRTVGLRPFPQASIAVSMVIL